MTNVDFVCEILDKFGFESDPVASLDESIQLTENEIAELDKEIRKGVELFDSNTEISSVKKRLVDTRRKATFQTLLTLSHKNCQKLQTQIWLILNSKICDLQKKCF
ncbi:unnamed protein product [Oikopleura dioica]|uniref:Uncharacterized protein n=1 Tax=Oikopleura dioica TaxID=34765 RepID=E4XNZ7_OIKDI|nr:unnamed protein product [Oikopleura dioica]